MTIYFPHALRASSMLLCTIFIAACGSKLTEPVKAAPAFQPVSAALMSSPAPYESSAYGVPEASRVGFNPSAQTAVQDLTY